MEELNLDKNYVDELDDKIFVALEHGVKLSQKISNRIEKEFYEKLYDEVDEICVYCKTKVIDGIFDADYIKTKLLIVSKIFDNYSKLAKNRSAIVKLQALGLTLVDCSKSLKNKLKN